MYVCINFWDIAIGELETIIIFERQPGVIISRPGGWWISNILEHLKMENVIQKKFNTNSFVFCFQQNSYQPTNKGRYKVL